MEKTTAFICHAVETIKDSQGAYVHYLGQKGTPMLMTMSGFKYDRFNLLEWMHNIKCAFDNFLDMLVGRDDGGKWDMKARTTSQSF